MENKQDKGFTLVELLIVIVILGILATVTVFAVRGITEKGQENACSVEQRALETAVEACYVDSETQTFPASLAELETVDSSRRHRRPASGYTTHRRFGDGYGRRQVRPSPLIRL